MESQSKVLIFRLSSMGDVILASGVLDPQRPVDWVVFEEFSKILEGHSGIRRLWVFSRGSGLLQWIRFCRKIADQQYDEVFDLHGSLRTQIARVLFLLWNSKVRWHSTPKQRWKSWGYYLFKSLWPVSIRPRPKVKLFAQTRWGFSQDKEGISFSSQPNLRHLIQNAAQKPIPFRSPYLCVMPSSKWSQKEWPVERYFEYLCRQATRKPTYPIPVILGTSQDSASVRLVKLLEKGGLPHISGVGKWDLSYVAKVLSGSVGYLGGDTGLAHLAEAVGVSSWMIFGPTTPQMGFGPWQPKSKAVGKNLWCRPCGKDGRYCFRVQKRYLCLSGLSVDDVMRQIERT